MSNKLPNLRDVKGLQAEQFKPGVEGHLLLFIASEMNTLIVLRRTVRDSH